MPHSSLVAITIVTFNSSRYIRRCLEYALAQDYENKTIVVVDNASTDGTPEILKEFDDRARIFYNRANNGFAGGQNQAINAGGAEWSLTLNPDVRLTPDFVSRLIDAAEHDPAIGSVCGKLLAMTPEFEPLHPPVFDSAGIFVTPNMRHFDRGSLEPDRGQYNQPEYIFGATGAACLYRQTMIEDVSYKRSGQAEPGSPPALHAPNEESEFFDEDFFAYREDADVAWRAQLLGWKCAYVPSALAYHVRSVLPSNRSSLPAIINMHSVKNRWLLRIKNTTPSLYRKYWLSITVRDMVVVAGCLLSEWSSLRAFALVAKMWKRTWHKRAQIMQKRRASDEYIDSWFCYEPVSYAVPSNREKIVPH